MADSNTEFPSELTGGCACGSVRYTISVPDEKSKPQGSTCQCTTCRKWTSALISHALQISPSNFHLTSSTTLKNYKSDEKVTRTFCGTCGGGISWRHEDMPDILILMAGTLDEKWMMGERVEGSEEKTDMGTRFEWKGGLGRELCTPTQNLFRENVVPGVTDHHLGGKEFLQNVM